MLPNCIRTVVIEDERLARAELTRQLSRFADIELVGEAVDIDSARTLLTACAPQLAFLDIQLADGCGFDLLSAAPAGMQTIIVSAYEAYALRAFEVSAIDYLLKPVAPERLRAAIAKAGQALSDPADSDATAGVLDYEDYVFLSLGDSASTFLPVKSILAVVAEGDYTRVQTGDGHSHLVLKPLKHWQARLPDSAFARIHRSTIVNVRRVRRIDAWLNRRFRVFLDGLPRPLTMSRRYAHTLKHRFG